VANFWSMNSARFPAKGIVGDVYMAAETKKLFIAVADGRLIPLEGLLNPVTVEGARGEKGENGTPGGIGPRGIQGPPGRDGIDGKSVSGPKGSRGAQGRQGVAGKDGRDGIDGKDGATGAQGPQGPAGPAGAVLYVGDAEMAAAVKALRDEMIATKARVEAAFDVTMLEAFRNHGSKAVTIQSYLNRMRQRAGVTSQEWSQADMQAIRKYLNGGGTIAELIAACVKE
jgi:hypothetical protein